MQLKASKCFPVLYYGPEACPLCKSKCSSISYAINSTFRKIFNTRIQEVLDVCLAMFSCLPAEQPIVLRKHKFLKKFIVTITLCVKYSLIVLKRTGVNCSSKLSSSSSWLLSRRGPSRRRTTVSAANRVPPEVYNRTAGVVSKVVDPLVPWPAR